MTTVEMVELPGGSFRMGSDRHYREEAPVHTATVAPFAIRSTTVTNAEFATFVEATGYVTVAERPLDPADYPGAPPENLVPGSLVFVGTAAPVDLRDLTQWWRWTPGACWRHPEGPGSEVADRSDHPVVHVSAEDAEAYATWAGQRLPTEAEWEFAARGGLEGATFAWGDDAVPEGRYLANFWQGAFPWRNVAADGFAGTAPVRSYPPNGYGLYEVTGNVWEWTADWYLDHHEPGGGASCCAPELPRDGRPEDSFDPAQPEIRIPRRVLKGGSFLCADEYCHRYRPAARQPQMIDSAMSHLGFRTAADL